MILPHGLLGHISNATISSGTGKTFLAVSWIEAYELSDPERQSPTSSDEGGAQRLTWHWMIA
ncbi:hypothetical protein [Novipirellula aureliae]|nr:hypothetical protein [Novipirellula aureliae]